MAAAPCKGFPRTARGAEWHRAAMLRVKRAGQQLLTELTLSFLTALVQKVSSLMEDGQAGQLYFDDVKRKGNTNDTNEVHLKLVNKRLSIPSLYLRSFENTHSLPQLTVTYPAGKQNVPLWPSVAYFPSFPQNFSQSGSTLEGYEQTPQILHIPTVLEGLPYINKT